MPAQPPETSAFPTAITRSQASRYAALDLRCPEAGTKERPDVGDWLRLAHGWQFALDGALERDPDSRRLTRVRSRMSCGVLTVG